MRSQTVTILILLIGSLLVSSCSNKPSRQAQLDDFLSDSDHLIVYYAQPINLDTQLSDFKMDPATLKLRQAYRAEDENLRTIEAIKQEVPALEDGTVIRKKDWSILREKEFAPETLVWFVDLRAQANYSRFPLKLDHFRITYTLAAKVLPLSQFLAGNATLSMSTTLWQNVCQFKAENGQFYSVQDWTKNRAERLQKSLQKMRQTCIQKLQEAL